MSRATIIDAAVDMYNKGNLYRGINHILENGGSITEEQFMHLVRIREKEDEYISHNRSKRVKPITKEKTMGTTDVLDRSDAYWVGPQFKVYEDVDISNTKTKKVLMDVVASEDGYVSEGNTYYAGTVPTTYVYTVAGENDWYVCDGHNDELVSGREQLLDMKGKKLKKVRSKLNSSEESWMYAHEAEIEEEIDKDEFWENFTSAYIDPITDEAKLNDPVFVIRDNTEIKDYKLLNFWGYNGKKDRGYSSVIWTAIRYGRKAAIKRVVNMKDKLTEGELEWLREMLSDINITISRDIKNLLPLRTVYVNRSNRKDRKLREYNSAERSKWLATSRDNIIKLYNKEKEDKVVRYTYIGKYTRKDGTVVKAHYRKITNKAITSWNNNLVKARARLAGNIRFYTVKQELSRIVSLALPAPKCKKFNNFRWAIPSEYERLSMYSM